MSYGISDIPYLRRDFALSSSKSRWATGIVLSAGLDTNFSRFSKLLGLERAAVVEILFGLLKSPYVFWSALTDVIRLSANTSTPISSIYLTSIAILDLRSNSMAFYLTIKSSSCLILFC